MTITRDSAEHSPHSAIFIQISGSRREADTAVPLGLDVIEDITDRAALGEVPTFDSKVLLQGLMMLFGLALQSSVDLF